MVRLVSSCRNTQSILPNLCEGDAHSLLMSHSDGVADAADAYFLSQASAAKGTMTPPRTNDGQASSQQLSPQAQARTMHFNVLPLNTCDESAISPQVV